ncbi:MAG: tyrosine-type recombinase/integrase, partial [Flavobacteriaceae bacterium]
MKSKIILPNGCSMSTPFIYPKNWKTGNSKLLSINWRIQYYFYPPNKGKRKLVVVKGMNTIKNLTERRKYTEKLLHDEIDNNLRGYNAIEKKYTHVIHQEDDLNPYLDFILAYRIAINKMRCTHAHRKNLLWCVNTLEKNVVNLGLQSVTIGQLKRKQLKRLFESLDVTNYTYNKFLGFLSRIYNELLEYECCEINIVRDISKRKVIKKQREILSPDEHKAVMEYLHKNYYEFWRYARIFLFSGARSTELFRVRVNDVDIDNQEYKTIILKGSDPHEVTKVIIEEVVPLWRELLKGAKPNDYLFSRGLKSGKESINSYQITKRWLRLVKTSDKIKDSNGEVLNITADFYALKHSFLDSLPEETAMLIAS